MCSYLVPWRGISRLDTNDTMQDCRYYRGALFPQQYLSVVCYKYERCWGLILALILCLTSNCDFFSSDDLPTLVVGSRQDVDTYLVSTVQDGWALYFSAGLL